MRLDDPFDDLVFPAVPSAQPGGFFIWRKSYFLARLYKSHTADIQSHDSRLATAKLSALSPKPPLPVLKHRPISRNPNVTADIMPIPQIPKISTRNEMRILNWGHVAQITMVLAVIILAFIKIGTGNVRGRGDVWGLSVVSSKSKCLFDSPHVRARR
jgi:hypothetical protein